MARGPLEREDELDLLRRAVADAKSGIGGAVLVEGVAGIGKTALLREARRTAEFAQPSSEAPLTLFARGAELEGDFAFGAVRQLLEPTLETSSQAQRDQLLGGGAAPARAVFALADGSIAEPDPGYDVLHALYLLTARLAAERPLLIEVDDVHWADIPSLRFFTFLTHRIDAMPALVILGARPAAEWRQPEHYDLLTGDGSMPIVRPRPLSRAAAEQLAAEAVTGAVDDSFASACHEASGGNPFYLRALLREAAERGLDPSADHVAEVKRLGPEAVRRSVVARLRRLSDDARAFARAAAVLGERAPQRIVAQLARLPQEQAVAAGDELRAVGILEGGLAITFEHPIVRSAVYELYSTGERAAAHAEAARILRAAGADNDVVAAQLLLAEPVGSEDSIEVLRAAAGEANARGAPDVAAVYLQRALDEGAPDDLRGPIALELGLAESLRRLPSAREHLEEALELAPDPDTRLGTAIALWSVLSFDGLREKGIAMLEQELARSPDADPDIRLRVEIEIAREMRAGLDSARAGRERAEALKQRDWDPSKATDRMALAVLGIDAVFTGRPAEELSHYVEQILPERGSWLGSHDSQIAPIPFYLLVYADRIDEATSRLTDVIAEAEQRGSMLGAEIGSLWRSMAHLRAGALADAEADARRVLDGVHETRWQFGQIAATHFLAEVLLERGEIAAARNLYAPITGRMPRRGWWNNWRWGVARVELAAGHPKKALDMLMQVGKDEELFCAERPWVLPWRSDAALAAAAVGDIERARSLVEEELEISYTFGPPRPVGIALRARGLIRGGADGIRDLEEAVGLLAGSPAKLEYARVLVDLGGLMRREGKRAAAREHLTKGLDAASRCGATALAERARSELQASGARPRRERMSGPSALTGSELRVARLAAGGATNPEIAQTLFVTRKTVEKHLANTYSKLEISSRDELATALSKE